MRHFTLLALPAVLAACASPLPPTLDEADVAASKARLAVLETMPATTVAAMPTTGAASYTGRVGADLTGGSDGSVLADVSLTATFSSGDVTGEIYNINVFDDSGAPDQKLKGKVPLSGNVLTNKMTASGSGKLTGVDSGFTGDSTASVILNGQFRTNTAPADTVTGTITGSGTGDFDFVLANGKFYAE